MHVNKYPISNHMSTLVLHVHPFVAVPPQDFSSRVVGQMKNEIGVVALQFLFLTLGEIFHVPVQIFR